jgi:hypothetical protein
VIIGEVAASRRPVERFSRCCSIPASVARPGNDIVTGVGGRQVLLEDPSGNPIELFEPIRPKDPAASSP